MLPQDDNQFVQFYSEFWPATLLTLMLILAMRLIIAPKYTPAESTRKRWLSNSIIAAGLFSIGVYIVIDRLLVTGLVHIAIDSIEKSHAIRWQRQGVFPSHSAEGYSTFWLALRSLVVVLTAGVCLLATPVVRRRAFTAILWLLFFVALIYNANYAWWFATVEFPRVNPDLANQPPPTQWPDYCAGVVILLGIALAVGHSLAALAFQTEEVADRAAIQRPRVSGLMAIAAGLIALGCGSDSAWTISELLSTPVFWVASEPAWINWFVVLVQNLVFPEVLIPLAATISGAALVWQYHYPPADVTGLLPVRGSQIASFSAAVAIWLLVAIPTFAIFGFCYWLGPWVL